MFCLDPPSRFVKSIIVLMILGLLYTSYVAVRWGFADMYADDAYQVILGWNRGEALTRESWEVAYDAMETALELDPRHPAYLQRMGRLHTLKITQRLVDYDEYAVVAEHGKALFRASIEVRPYWPLAWADYALLKHEIGEIDTEFYEAIQRAAEYGPWEPGVHRILASIGIARFDLLDATTKAVVAPNIVRGFRSPTANAWRRMETTLKRYSNLDDRLIQDVVAGLVEAELRQDSYVHFVQLIEWLWPDLSGSTRRRVIEKIQRLVNNAEDDRIKRGVLKAVTKDDIKLRTCLGLPRDETVLQFCN